MEKLPSLLAFLILVGCAGKIPRQERRPSQLPQRVGLAASDVTPAMGVPLAGYGGGARRSMTGVVWSKSPFAHYLSPSQGTHDPIRAKAILFETSDGKILFLSLDVAAVPASIAEDLIERVRVFGISPTHIFISATHTHSGPGALSKNPLWEKLASDRFHHEVYREFTRKIVETVERANADLQPAQIFSLNFEARGLQRSRSGKQNELDPTANALLIQSPEGKWRGGLLNFAIHGTALGPSNLQFSADVPGGIERAVENEIQKMNPADPSPIFAMINGAEGDVSPIEKGFAGIEKIGDSFARQMIDALPNARPTSTEAQIFSAHVNLGEPRIQLSSCNRWTPSLVGDWAKWKITGLGPTTRISVLRLGDQAMVTWPGEPTNQIGLDLKQSARKVGIPHLWILGLTNDYLAYFISDKDTQSGTYESCSSLFGVRGSLLLIDAAKGMFLPMAK